MTVVGEQADYLHLFRLSFPLLLRSGCLRIDAMGCQALRHEYGCPAEPLANLLQWKLGLEQADDFGASLSIASGFRRAQVVPAGHWLASGWRLAPGGHRREGGAGQALDAASGPQVLLCGAGKCLPLRRFV